MKFGAGLRISTPVGVGQADLSAMIHAVLHFVDDLLSGFRDIWLWTWAVDVRHNHSSVSCVQTLDIFW